MAGAAIEARHALIEALRESAAPGRLRPAARGVGYIGASGTGLVRIVGMADIVDVATARSDAAAPLIPAVDELRDSRPRVRRGLHHLVQQPDRLPLGGFQKTQCRGAENESRCVESEEV